MTVQQGSECLHLSMGIEDTRHFFRMSLREIRNYIPLYLKERQYNGKGGWYQTAENRELWNTGMNFPQALTLPNQGERITPPMKIVNTWHVPRGGCILVIGVGSGKGRKVYNKAPCLREKKIAS